MKKKIPILFKSFSTINIVSILAFSLIITCMNIYYGPGKNLKSALFFLFLFVALYSINYSISLKMLLQNHRKIIVSKKMKTARIIFYTLECILLPFYGYGVYNSWYTMVPSHFYLKNFTELALLVTYTCFALGFLSSMVRIILLGPLNTIIKARQIELADTLIETDPEFLKNISH